MQKVKIFYSSDWKNNLEQEINDWIAANNPTINFIKQTQSHAVNSSGGLATTNIYRLVISIFYTVAE